MCLVIWRQPHVRHVHTRAVACSHMIHDIHEVDTDGLKVDLYFLPSLCVYIHDLDTVEHMRVTSGYMYLCRSAQKIRYQSRKHATVGLFGAPRPFSQPM